MALLKEFKKELADLAKDPLLTAMLVM